MTQPPKRPGPPPDPLRARVRALAHEALGRDDPTSWFERLYREAERDAGSVPWAECRTHPLFADWLSGHRLVGKGKRALVVGCGLGDDAEELARRGFRVTAFDISPTAIAWCRERFPATSVTYRIEDLFALGTDYAGGFDWVLEVFTVQALPPPLQARAIDAIAATVAPAGELLVACRGRDQHEPADGPPWGLTRQALAGFAAAGLRELAFEDFVDREMPPSRRFRVLYRRA